MGLLLGGGGEAVCGGRAADDPARIYGGGDLSGQGFCGVADCAGGGVCESVDGAAGTAKSVARRVADSGGYCRRAVLRVAGAGHVAGKERNAKETFAMVTDFVPFVVLGVFVVKSLM